MENFKNFLLFLWGGFFLFLFFLIFNQLKYLFWIKKIQKTPINPLLLSYFKDISQYKNLTPKEKNILHFKIQRFLKEKTFIGVKLDLTEEIKTVIAFYACLPTIYYKYFCYPSLKYIYVYPYAIILNSKSEIQGIVNNETMLISGEAVGESVIIVWDEAKKEIYHNLGRNVIIHEFAHELDFEEGMINGIPPISKSQYTEWTKIMFQEYDTFKHKLLHNRFLGKYSFLDKYAATNKAEFFAVMSEYYFSNPQTLKKHFPDIYKELKNFYKIEIKH